MGFNHLIRSSFNDEGWRRVSRHAATHGYSHIGTMAKVCAAAGAASIWLVTQQSRRKYIAGKTFTGECVPILASSVRAAVTVSFGRRTLAAFARCGF
jgi:hypothetical protein